MDIGTAELLGLPSAALDHLAELQYNGTLLDVCFLPETLSTRIDSAVVMRKS
jgi:hypothetical protein